MGRIHGRNGRIYMGLASSSATAEPLAYYATWDINFQTDKAETTALGDGNKVYVAGLPDASGTFDGFYDDSSVQTYQAAVDGQPRKFYLYPNTGNTGQYWFGTILPDAQIGGGVSGAVTAKASWAAASNIQKVG